MSTRFTRRELALGAMASSLLAQNQNQPESTSPMNDPRLDPVQWTRTRHASAPLRLTFNSSSKSAAEAWQKKLRAKVTELVGGFPDRKGAPREELIGAKDLPGFRRQRFLLESRPGVAISAYLLTPADAKGPLPVVICVPGHGMGADDIVGIDQNGNDRPGKPGYQHDFALQVVEHGLAAIAIEPMAFGCRRDAKTKSKGPGASACQPAAGAALLLGETMIGWRVYDVMRTIDWIGTRKELDATRIGCMGISGGGTCTLFSSALDSRIKAAFVSGYLNTFRDSILSLSHCIDNYIPGILNWAEMYDIAGLIAPRPLFAESGTRDNIFPIAASKESFARVRKIYDVFGAADQIQHEIFDGEHSFYGVQGIPFLAQHLRT